MRYMYLGSIAEFINGRAFKPSDWSNEGAPIIRIQNLNNEKAEFNYFEGKIDSKFKVDTGDVLLSWSGTPGTSFGCFLWSRGNAVLNQHIFKVRLNEEVVQKDYFIRAVNHNLKLLIDQAHGGVGLKHITKAKLLKVKIPVPSLVIQNQIVNALEKSEAICKRNLHIIQKYDLLVKSIFVDMFGDPLKNTKGWKLETLDAVTTKITDGTHHTPQYTDAGVPFLRVTDITGSSESKKYITEEEHSELIKRCHPERGDILYTKNGTIGIAKAIEWDFKFSIFVSLCLIKPNHELVDVTFLTTFLNTPFALQQAKKYSKKAAITNLHLSEIKKIKLPLPQIEMQKSFSRKVKAIENQKNRVRQELDKSKKLFNSISQLAFDGRLFFDKKELNAVNY